MYPSQTIKQRGMAALMGKMVFRKGTSGLDGRFRRNSGWEKVFYPLFFLSPWIIGLLVFSIYPIFSSFYLSLTNFNIFDKPGFIGTVNYTRLLSDPRFLKACRVTTTYVFLGVPFQLAFALLLALMLNRGIPGLRYFRAIYYLPALLGGSVAIGILWRQVFGMQGLLNSIMAFIGVPESITSISWITNPRYSIYTLILLRVWQFGSPMIIFLAGLKQIPAELYESASIEGAGKLRQFTSITLPMLSPIILFNLIMQIISAFQAFTPAYIISGSGNLGGSLDSLLFYTLYLYIMGFSYYRMGMASAMAWVLLVAVALLTFIIIKLSKNMVFYNED
jgi:multiple sugar transport system permease protein